MSTERMKRIYYNCEITNQTPLDKEADFSTTLLMPIIDNPDKYNLSVNRFRVPLNSIPLTLNNIPFQSWKVALSYNGTYSSAFVPQYNEKQTPTYKPTVITQTGNLEVWDSLTTQGTPSTIALQKFNTSSRPCYDTVQFTTTIGSTTTHYGSIYSYNSSTKFIEVYSATTGELLAEINCQNYVMAGEIISSVSCICCSLTGNIYFAYFPTNGVVGQTAFRIVELLKVNYQTWTISNNFYQLDMQYFQNQDCLPSSMCLDKFSHLLVNYDIQSGQTAYSLIYSYDLQSTQTSQTTVYPLFSWQGDDKYFYLWWGGQIIANNTDSSVVAYIFYTTGTGATTIINGIFSLSYSSETMHMIGQLQNNNTPVSHGLLGFDLSHNLLIASTANFFAYNLETGNIAYNFTPDMSAHYPFMITYDFQTGFKFTDAGDYPIYYYQDFLTKINEAFNRAFTALPSLAGSGVVTTPPIVMFDGATKMFYIMCESGYTSDLITIEMNMNLFNMFKFPSVPTPSTDPDYQGFRSIFTINTNSSSSNFIINQEASSISAFWDLVRILLVTSKIPVRGDIESVNSSINLVTDVVPDTTVLTPNDILVYQPTVLRWYNLNSNVALRDLNVQFYYGTRDGSVYPMVLFSGEYASVKLEFAQITD